MTADAGLPLIAVEQALLEVVMDARPDRLTLPELTLRMAADPHDQGEVETVAEAARELRRDGLFRYRNDDKVIELTRAAIRAYEILTR
jgi:hypothetical protein